MYETGSQEDDTQDKGARTEIPVLHPTLDGGRTGRAGSYKKKSMKSLIESKQDFLEDFIEEYIFVFPN